MTANRTILILGGTGQIGHELTLALAAGGAVMAPTRLELDLGDRRAIRDFISRSRPGLVVNAAGYTAVDAAESEPTLCAHINADAPSHLAAECTLFGAALVHLSTDYVFDGRSDTPYRETDPTKPLGIYGQTKLAGEEAVAAAGGAHLIVRTSWVYASRGRNFPLTMLRLAHERAEIRVVDDQTGAPTSAGAVAGGIADMIRTLSPTRSWFDSIGDVSGIYHMTASGSTTWYQFARSVLADDLHRLDQTCHALIPISTAEYPTAAQRPAYSVLDNTKLAERFGIILSSWEEQWQVVVDELRVSAHRPSLRATERPHEDRPTP